MGRERCRDTERVVRGEKMIESNKIERMFGIKSSKILRVECVGEKCGERREICLEGEKIRGILRVRK